VRLVESSDLQLLLLKLEDVGAARLSCLDYGSYRQALLWEQQVIQILQHRLKLFLSQEA